MSRLASIDFSVVSTSRAKVDWTIKQDDHMYAKNRLHYEEVGESALRCIISALMLANVSMPASVLDFGCGSGRVFRWLKAGFPNATVEACDVRGDALNFIADTFGANTWQSSGDIRSLEAPRQYDLIWSGSVLTHFDEGNCLALIDRFTDWLTPGGIAVFTTHGRRALSNLINRRITYTPPDKIEAIASAFRTNGFAFHPFSTSHHLGTSFNTLSWMMQVCSTNERRLVVASEAAWDKHQDVVAFQKNLASFDLA